MFPPEFVSQRQLHRQELAADLTLEALDVSKRGFEVRPAPLPPATDLTACVTTRYDDALHLMEAQGGSFVKSLAHCYCMADPSNKAILRGAFARYFESYEQRFRQHVAAVGRANGTDNATLHGMSKKADARISAHAAAPRRSAR